MAAKPLKWVFDIFDKITPKTRKMSDGLRNATGALDKTTRSVEKLDRANERTGRGMDRRRGSYRPRRHWRGGVRRGEACARRSGGD